MRLKKVIKNMVAICGLGAISLTQSKALPSPITPDIQPGTPVYDITAALHAADIVKNTAAQIEYHKQMIKALGDGKLTPSSINYLGSFYTQCVGKKFVLPEFLPTIPNLNICNNNSEETINSFYANKVLIDAKDSNELLRYKKEQLNKKRQQLRKALLSNSTKQLLFHEQKDPAAIDAFYKDIKAANSQMEILKIQTQIQLKLLEEIQEMKSNQALVMQSIGLTN